MLWLAWEGVMPWGYLPRVMSVQLVEPEPHTSGSSIQAGWLGPASTPSGCTHAAACSHPTKLGGTIYMLKVNHKHKSLQDQGCRGNQEKALKRHMSNGAVVESFLRLKHNI